MTALYLAIGPTVASIGLAILWLLERNAKKDCELRAQANRNRAELAETRATSAESAVTRINTAWQVRMNAQTTMLEATKAVANDRAREIVRLTRRLEDAAKRDPRIVGELARELLSTGGGLPLADPGASHPDTEEVRASPNAHVDTDRRGAGK